jgi:hypothetical protein
MKITDIWNTGPCSLVEIDRLFRGAYCLHHQGDHGAGLSSLRNGEVDLRKIGNCEKFVLLIGYESARLLAQPVCQPVCHVGSHYANIVDPKCSPVDECRFETAQE